MTKKEQLELIKENSYMKYCICELVKNISDKREYRELKRYLEEILHIEKKQNFAEKYYEKLGILESGKNEK